MFQRVLGFPPRQRRDGGVGFVAGVAALGVGGQSRLFPLLLVAVRVVHGERDERGGLPVEGQRFMSKCWISVDFFVCAFVTCLHSV